MEVPRDSIIFEIEAILEDYKNTRLPKTYIWELIGKFNYEHEENLSSKDLIENGIISETENKIYYLVN